MEMNKLTCLIVQDEAKTSRWLQKKGHQDAACVKNPLGQFKLFSQQGGYLTLAMLLYKLVSQSFFASFCVE